jgi:glycosyltransferase involved in cell wall biosynthesis
MINKGGAELVVERLASELSEKGFDITLFTDKFDYSYWGKNKPYKIHEFNKGEQHLALRKWKKIGKILSTKLADFDLINVHNHPSSIYVYYAKKVNPNIKSPVVWYCEEPYRYFYGDYLGLIDNNTRKNIIKDRESFLKRLKKLMVAKKLLKEILLFLKWKFFVPICAGKDIKATNKIDLILANSNFTSVNVERCFNKAADPCLLGLMDNFKDFTPRYEHFFLTISRIEKEKNILNTIKAVENLNRQNKLKDFKYIVCGKGEELENVKKYISSKKLDDIVILKGFVSEEEKIKLYSDALFCIYLPHDEPFGLVCLESFHYKKTMIVSNHGGVSEIVRKDIDGLHVNPGSIVEIENAILLLVEDKEKAIQMGEAAYLRLKNHFLFEHFIERFMNLIQNKLNVKFCRNK